MEENVGQWIRGEYRKTCCQRVKHPFCLGSNSEEGYDLNATHHTILLSVNALHVLDFLCRLVCALEKL